MPTESPTEIVVTWNTIDPTENTVVEYGIGGPILRAEGESKIFIDGGKKSRIQFIHTVRLKDLTPGATYGNYND